MAEDYAQNEDADLLSLELGIAVDEDDFKKAEQQIDQLKDKMDSWSSTSEFKIAPINMGALDSLIKSIEGLIAVLDKLDDINIEIAKNTLGGAQYGLTNEEYYNVKQVDRRELAKTYGVTSDALYGAMAEASRQQYNTRWKGKLDEDLRIDMNYLGLVSGEEQLQGGKANELFVEGKSPAEVLSVVWQAANDAFKKYYKTGEAQYREKAVNALKHFFDQSSIDLLEAQAFYNYKEGVDYNFLQDVFYGKGGAKVSEDKSLKTFSSVASRDQAKTIINKSMDAMLQAIGGVATDTLTGVTRTSADIMSYFADSNTKALQHGITGESPFKGNFTEKVTPKDLEATSKMLGFDYDTGLNLYTPTTDELTAMRNRAMELYKGDKPYKGELALWEYSLMEGRNVPAVQGYLQNYYNSASNLMTEYNPSEYPDIASARKALEGLSPTEVIDFLRPMIGAKETANIIKTILEQFRVQERWGESFPEFGKNSDATHNRIKFDDAEGDTLHIVIQQPDGTLTRAYKHLTYSN